MQTLQAVADESQQPAPVFSSAGSPRTDHSAPIEPTESPILDELIEDVRSVRNRAFSNNPRSRAGVAAGQFMLLLLQLRSGLRPSRKSLRNFFFFVGGGIRRPSA